MRLLSTVLISVSLLSSPARSDEPELVPTKPVRTDTQFSAGDWLAAWLAGNVAGGIGGFLGASIGYAGGGGFAICLDDDCVPHDNTATWVGFGVGATFGGAAGIYAYGELSGHSGNYWATSAGFALGLAGSIGLAAIVDSETGGHGPGWSWIALFILPALGGTAGYVLTLDDGSTHSHIPTGGLVDFDGGVFRLGVPDISVDFDGRGGLERVDLRLIGARF